MTGGPLEPVYSPQAAAAFDSLENDAGAAVLFTAVLDAVDLICDQPGSAAARRESLRTASGATVWRVPVRVAREAEDWCVLWIQDDGGRALIAFIGVL